jgi:hypothetical protein
MMIKVLKVSSYYRDALAWVYRRNPGLGARGYDVQHAVLMAERLAWSDSWKHYLEELGSFAVEEVIFNAEPLQRQWAVKHGVICDEGTWMRDIFSAQLDYYRPDVLFAHAPEVALACTEYLPTGQERPFVVGYDGVARHDRRLIDNCDLILTCLRRTEMFYRDAGVPVMYLPYGFDRRWSCEIARSRAEPVDLAFIGSLQVRIGHQERALLLDHLAQSLPLRAWLSMVPDDGRLLRMFVSFLRHGELGGALAFPATALAVRRLRGISRGELFGLNMLAQLGSSRLSLNSHIAAAGDEAVNVRLFEATGAGTCLLTDWKPGLKTVFEPDHEVVAYRSREEAVEKARYLLDNENVRSSIARRGQERTWRSYGLADGIGQVAEYLERHL